MKDKLATLKQLDNSLYGSFSPKNWITPRQGWVRTIRKAIGMTIKQLAKRMGVGPSRVVKIETAEREGTVTLKTMETVAQHLDCKFVYAFIPNTRLEEAVRSRAKLLATESVRRSALHMDLEAQTVDQKWLDEQADDLAHELLKKSWRIFWEE